MQLLTFTLEDLTSGAALGAPLSLSFRHSDIFRTLIFNLFLFSLPCKQRETQNSYTFLLLIFFLFREASCHRLGTSFCHNLLERGKITFTSNLNTTLLPSQTFLTNELTFPAFIVYWHAAYEKNYIILNVFSHNYRDVSLCKSFYTRSKTFSTRTQYIVHHNYDVFSS